MTPNRKTLSFPAKFRLRGRGVFSEVIAARNSASDANLIIYALANDLSYSRAGISAGRKVGNAVKRNRLKRLLREAFRQNREALPAGYDFVIIPRPQASDTLGGLTASLLDCVRRAVARAKTNSARTE